jgi:hypothetical protein
MLTVGRAVRRMFKRTCNLAAALAAFALGILLGLLFPAGGVVFLVAALVVWIVGVSVR